MFSFSHHLPNEHIVAGGYKLRFAQTDDDLEALGRLRFEVFNLELGEGLDAAYITGKDEDKFDQICHHMIVCEEDNGVIVGTYRLQTNEMAIQGGLGFYSATEFDLSEVPAPVIAQTVEIGRACIAKEHRSLNVLYLLWHGLGIYLRHNQKQYLFGCSSLTSQDPMEGRQVMNFLEQKGHIHPTISVKPLPEYICYPESLEVAGTAKVPRLMRVYLSMGAKVCGPPALDRQFKTIDYLTLMDVKTLDVRTLTYFGYQ